MKPYVMSNIQNVKDGYKMINQLISRPITELVGLGLIYGAPGLGKTRFAHRVCSQERYVWMRLESSSTPKSFVQSLFNALKYKANMSNEIPVGSTNTVFQKCLEMLNDMPNTVIMLDEIDYAFADKSLLGTVRDIVDETVASVVMIGMRDAYNKLLKANSHYFDRCNAFCEFKPLNAEDIGIVLQDISDVKILPDLVNALAKKTCGNLRQTVDLLNLIEKIAKKKCLNEMGFKDVKRYVNFED